MQRRRPRLLSVVFLRCLYCGKTPLLDRGSWFRFASGCSACNYRFEREEGYFVGGTWMISFPLVSLFGIAVAGSIMGLGISSDGLTVAAITSVAVAAFAVLSFNHCNALWMYLDHLIHPLTE